MATSLRIPKLHQLIAPIFLEAIIIIPLLCVLVPLYRLRLRMTWPWLQLAPHKGNCRWLTKLWATSRATHQQKSQPLTGQNKHNAVKHLRSSLLFSWYLYLHGCFPLVAWVIGGSSFLRSLIHPDTFSMVYNQVMIHNRWTHRFQVLWWWHVARILLPMVSISTSRWWGLTKIFGPTKTQDWFKSVHIYRPENFLT